MRPGVFWLGAVKLHRFKTHPFKLQRYRPISKAR